jgi:inosine-uridine nucleoside N-ribohydrolase
MHKIPVILDTDIGGDIDDTWALAMLLKSPELDLKLVVTDTGNTIYRAKVASKLLKIAERTDVPVGVGLHQSHDTGPQASWVENYNLDHYKGDVFEDGVGALIDNIMSSPEPVTLICIGPVTNIAAALQREPAITQNARFVGMHGSIYSGYDGSSEVSAEYNVRADPAACRAVFNASWDVTITPLDTCGLVRLTGGKYSAVRDCDDPLTRAVIENYRIWSAHRIPSNLQHFYQASSTLFDPVAVYLAFSEELLSMENLGLRVTDDGFTVVDETSKAIHCAVGWKDLPAFEDLLVRRLTNV